MSSTVVSKLLLLIEIAIIVDCFQPFQGFIPNGDRVQNPCNPGQIWQGVGHTSPEGGTARNPFGLDFYFNDKKWDAALCQKDSDGDGRSNGEELGDRNCTWTPGAVLPNSTTVTHPGICEPMHSDVCMQRNSWLKCVAEPFSCPAFNKENTQHIRLTFPNTSVPAQETTYICYAFKLPTDKEYHMIGYKPVLDNTDIIHHILISACTQPISEDSLRTPYICGMAIPACQVVIGVWSRGQQGECHPDEYGFPIGLSGYKYLTLQLHWTNPAVRSDLFDGSGIDLYYTTDLRPNNAMVVMVGQTQLILPPGQDMIVQEGACTKDCSQYVPPQSISYISTVYLHMHLQGRGGTVSLIKNSDGSRQIISDQRMYDYNSPETIRLTKPLQFQTGDEFSVTCEFQTRNKNVTTIFGEATHDEMCLAFITFYPSVQGFDYCYRWMDNSQCSFPQFNYSDVCNIRSFRPALAAVAYGCDKTCNKTCMDLIQKMRSFKCFGTKYEKDIRDVWPIGLPILSQVFKLYDFCTATAQGSNSSTTSLGSTTGTISVTVTPSSTTKVTTKSINSGPRSHSFQWLCPAFLSFAVTAHLFTYEIISTF